MARRRSAAVEAGRLGGVIGDRGAEDEEADEPHADPPADLAERTETAGPGAALGRHAREIQLVVDVEACPLMIL